MAEQKLSFEDKMTRLKEIVQELEKGELPLEQGLELFKEGSELAKQCREQLKQAKHKVQTYSQGILQDFEPEEAQDESDSGQDQT